MNPRTPIRLMDPPANRLRTSYAAFVAAMLLGATFSLFFAYGLLLLNAMPW